MTACISVVDPVFMYFYEEGNTRLQILKKLDELYVPRLTNVYHDLVHTWLYLSWSIVGGAEDTWHLRSSSIGNDIGHIAKETLIGVTQCLTFSISLCSETETQ